MESFNPVIAQINKRDHNTPRKRTGRDWGRGMDTGGKSKRKSRRKE